MISLPKGQRRPARPDNQHKMMVALAHGRCTKMRPPDQLHLLRTQTTALLSRIQPWSRAQHNFRPNLNDWSALEVLDHLSKVEQSILGALKSNLPQGHVVSLKDRVGGMIVNLVMRSPLKVKVPPGAKVFPDAEPDLPAISRRWTEAQSEMAELLNSLSTTQRQVGLFHHPRSGWMTIGQTLSFLSAHMRHHEYQLARIARAFTPPVSS